jgi:spore germination protein GerM
VRKIAAPSILALALLLLLRCGGDTTPPAEGATGSSVDAVGAEAVKAEAADSASAATEEALDPEEIEQDDPLRTTTVEIYFPSTNGDGLIGEFREIFNTATPGDRAKQIVSDLISGPTSNQALRAISPGTRLRQAYVLENGVAYLDFSQELADGLGGGSMNELLTVYAIVDSVALGVQEIKRVAILINGRPIETMNGHLDLRGPLKPNARFILGSVSI